MNNQPTCLQKLIFIPIGFSFLFLIGGLIKGFGWLLLIGSFIFFPALIAVGIDHIRLNTAWSIGLKVAAFAVVFLIGFIAMVIAIQFMDTFGLFR